MVYTCVTSKSGRFYEVVPFSPVFLAEEWAVPVTDDTPDPPHTTRFASVERR
jgi:hypothetical protein